MTPTHLQRGFTLVEVMVALVIASLGLAAVSVAVSQHTDTARKLRDRTLAMYVASNALAELRLAADFPDLGRTSDDVEFAGRNWIVQTTILETGIDGLRRADVSIRSELRPDDTIRTVSGFVSQQPALPIGAVPYFDDLNNAEGERT